MGSSPIKPGPPSEPYVDSDAASLSPTSAHYGKGLKPVVTAAAASAKVNEAAANDKDRAALAVKHEELHSSGSEALCLRTYLVLGRLFKLHPDFDVAIAGILAGDPSGCVVLIHETRDEEWTRTVWSRLRETLLPQGIGSGRDECEHCPTPTVLCRIRGFVRVETAVSRYSTDWRAGLFECTLAIKIHVVCPKDVPTRQRHFFH